MPSMASSPTQLILDLGIEMQRDINGIEMGVLDNGIPFLTQTGLANICGVTRSQIQDISAEWEEHIDDDILTKDRISYIKEQLFSKGYSEKKLYIETRKNGVVHHAYPDIVCSVVLEYYAFEAKTTRPVAIKNYRNFASFGMQSFIYQALGYKPQDVWDYHRERISILQTVRLMDFSSFSLKLTA
ncbi:MAG: hypothetical protein COC24_013120 [Alphaproteobacteria bacterium]|nr:hypothetical protein [Alphaproteobacteria bacterium]